MNGRPVDSSSHTFNAFGMKIYGMDLHAVAEKNRLEHQRILTHFLGG